jgi:predicted MPP superfamily phosphohydrolase
LPFPTRRRFLQLAAGVAATGVLALAEDGIVESNRPAQVTIQVELARLPAAFDGFTIAQLSDFHYDEQFSVVPLKAAIEIVNGLQPDLIVLTGDFVTVPMLHRVFHSAKQAASAIEPCSGFLTQLRSRLGTVAILGNHDVDTDPPRIIETLQSHGISVLRNRSMALEREGSRVWLCGLDAVTQGRQDINRALHGVPRNELVVLLVHEPDFADEAALYPVDLQLSGHSHGGQVWIPGVGAPWLPEFARKYPRGLRRIGPLTLYTNMGLGTIRLPIRLDCPPEITLFTLRSGDSTFKQKVG